MKSEWNSTEIWKAKGKAMDTNTDESPGYQSQSYSLDVNRPIQYNKRINNRLLLKKFSRCFAFNGAAAASRIMFSVTRGVKKFGQHLLRYIVLFSQSGGQKEIGGVGFLEDFSFIFGVFRCLLTKF